MLLHLAPACGAAPDAGRQKVLDTLVALDTQAKAARKAGDEEALLKAYEQMLTLEFPPKLRDFRGRVHYGVACVHGRAGRAEQALDALEAASKTGWTEAEHTAKDDDLALIRQSPRFTAALRTMREARTRLKVYEITTWENPSLSSSMLRFDEMASANAQALREEFDLPALVANTRTQLEAHTAVLAWVHDRWAHSGLNEPVSPNALDILHAVQEGARFRCVEYSIVLAQALNALGYPARVVSLRQAGMSYGTGKGHVISEVWNDDLRQWVAVDGQNNAYWTHEGRPLSARQVQMLRHRGKAGEIELVHGGSTWMPKPPNREMWLSYFHAFQLAHDNRIFDKNPAHAEKSSTAKSFLLPHGVTPELLFQGAPLEGVDIITDADPLYPLLNSVHIEVAPQGAQLELKLSHNTPSFSHFTVNGARIEGAHHTWDLSPGENTLTIRAVNTQGIEGAPSKITLVYHPPSTP
ncbi:MAG: transglutaminase-like domain-containing protein [Bradymonadia bacterium]